jgi:hypothetical protein
MLINRLILIAVFLLTGHFIFSQCNQTTNISFTETANSCPAGTVTYSLTFSSMTPNGNNSICYGYTVTNPDGTFNTTNIGPVNQSNSNNSNWNHTFNVTISCTQRLTLFLNAWSNLNCGGMMCPSPRSRVVEIAALPVTLSEFVCFRPVSGIQLSWTTENEVNNEGFYIEHAEDKNDDFVPVGFVRGSGNSDKQVTYHFVHENAPAGQNYYRLKQVDLDGRFDYSDVVWCSILKNESIRLLTQQVSDYIQIVAEKSYNLQIFDYFGKSMQNITCNEGYNQFDISSWPKGIYFISDGFSYNKRFIKL